MHIEPEQPTRKGPAQWFTGDVYIDAIHTRKAEPSRMACGCVHFTPGVRTAWHSHAVGQTLYVTEGRGLAQSRGGKTIELLPGDSIDTSPGEWHWHGAAPGHFMTHVAMWEAPEEGPESNWGDHVT